MGLQAQGCGQGVRSVVGSGNLFKRKQNPDHLLHLGFVRSSIADDRAFDHRRTEEADRNFSGGQFVHDRSDHLRYGDRAGDVFGKVDVFHSTDFNAVLDSQQADMFGDEMDSTGIVLFGCRSDYPI